MLEQQVTNRVIRLTPPVLSGEALLAQVVCTRPMREGCFNISTEARLGKKIVHCFGHGGAGLTTFLGSVAEALRLYQRDFAAAKTEPICVIGAGCMGLTAAIELARTGCTNLRIVAEEIYDTPSWRAGGYFAFVSIKTSPQEQQRLGAIGEETFKTFQRISRGEHPYLAKETLRYLPVYCGKGTDSGIEELSERKLLPPPEEVTLDFGSGVKHAHFQKYSTYYVETTLLMRQLMAEVKRLGIPIEKRRVEAFDELSEERIFNCSGLGGRELAHDARVKPVRGHLILLNALAGSQHMDYMIYTSVLQDGKKEYIYMFPKETAVSSEYLNGLACRGVLGGTFIPQADALTREELAELDAREFKKMLQRNQMFFHGIRDSV